MQSPSGRSVSGAWRWWLRALPIMMLHLLTPASTRAADTYYMAVFSSQTEPNLPRYSHTFAAFVHVAAGGVTPCRVECVTISWLPQSLVLHPWRLQPEPGVNLGLEATIRWACSNNARISVWGPFQIKSELYQRAVSRALFLGSGAIAYKVIDYRFEPCRAVDCIHALSGVDMDRGILRSGTAHGDSASYLDLVHLSGWIVDPTTRHDWVLQQLGLACYPIERRGWSQECVRLHYDPRTQGAPCACAYHP